MTDVTARRGLFCYTAINAFATVCSSRGDPVGSDTLPHFLPAVRFQRQFQCERHAKSPHLYEKLTLSPSRKKTIEWPHLRNCPCLLRCSRSWRQLNSLPSHPSRRAPFLLPLKARTSLAPPKPAPARPSRS